ncbi:hypothetical protein SCA6_018546 [Theobroma cacao]
MDILSFMFTNTILLILFSEPKGNDKVKIAVTIPIAIFIVAGVLLVSCYICSSRASSKGARENNVINDRSIEGQREDSEVQLFDLALISKATNDFSIDNKLGQGGFGPVYRAWDLWKEEKAVQLIDPLLKESCNLSEVARGIHIGLLCLQQHPEDRPNMSSVVLMLGSDTALSKPKQPGFLMERKSPETDSTSSKLESSSTNDISMSILEGR